jgi:hypothetical protein
MSELVFTDEQLTLLATLAGEPGFPGAPAPELDEAGWVAVASGLLARGVLHDDDSDGEVHDSDAVLGIALFAPCSLWISMSYAPGEGSSRQEILWLDGDAVVRQTRTPDGFHFFTTGDRSAVAELQESVLAFLDGAPSQSGERGVLTEFELEDALELLHEEGADAAVRRHPAAAGYVAALDDARCVVSVECSRRVGDDLVEGDGLTLVDSPDHGLWLAREDPWGEEPGGELVVVQRVSAGDARAQVAAVAELLDAPPDDS